MCLIQQNEGDVEQRRRGWARGGKLSVFCCCLACALADLSYALFAPFFPSLAVSRGVSHAAVGAVFAQPMLVMLMLTPLAPRLIQYAGCNRVLLVGMLIQSISVLAFAFIERLEEPLHFTIAALLLRSVQGGASAFFETAAGSLVMRAVPENMVGDAIGWTEAARGLGSLGGPPLGGLLFQTAGFEAPFLAAGGAMLLMNGVQLVIALSKTSTSAALLPPADASATASKASSSPWRMLQMPPIAAGAFICTCFLIAISFLDPSLQPEMKARFGMGPAQVGLLFGTLILAYILLSLVAGATASRLGSLLQLNLGIALTGLGYIALGPIPLLPHGERFQSVPQVAAAMAVIGLGAGLGYVPMTNLMLAAARSTGRRVDEISDALSAIVNFSFCVGAAAGPWIGGVLVQFAGFDWASSILGMCMLSLPAFSLPFMLSASRALKRSKLQPAHAATDALLIAAGATASVPITESAATSQQLSEHPP